MVHIHTLLLEFNVSNSGAYAIHILLKNAGYGYTVNFFTQLSNFVKRSILFFLPLAYTIYLVSQIDAVEGIAQQ